MPSIAAVMAYTVACHDAAHGGKVRPLGVKPRFDWRDVACHWTRCHVLRYSEVRSVAEELGRDPMRPKDDTKLREEFARRLRAIGETRPRPTAAELKRGRLIGDLKRIACATRESMERRYKPPA